jgi:hypothetical protein
MGMGLDLMAAIVAPHDQPHLGRSGSAKRDRRVGLGFHPPRHMVIILTDWRRWVRANR